MGILQKLFGTKSQAKAGSVADQTDAQASHAASTTASAQYNSQQTVKKRQQALKNIDDIAVLLHAYHHDEDELVVDCADRRLREILLLIEDDSDVEPLQAHSLSLKTCKTLAAKAKSPAIRLALLDKIDDDQSLSEVIVHCDDMNTQVAAIAKLNGRETLNALIKRYKGKQKKLYRAAKDRLNIVKTRHQHTETLQQQFDTLTQSAEAQTLSMTAILSAEKQLAALAGEVPNPVLQKHQRTLETLTKTARDIEAAKNARQTVLTALSQAHEALTTGQFEGTRDDFNHRMNAQQQAWLALPDWSAAEAKSLAIRFEQLLSRANTAASEYFSEKQHKNAQAKCLAQCEHWLKPNTFVTEEMLGDQEARWQSLPPLAEPSAQSNAQSTFDALMSQLRAKSQRQITAQRDNDNAIHAHVEAFAEAVENGELKKAQQVQTAIRDCLHSEARLSKPVYQDVIGRIKRLENRLTELKKWQHFGDDHVRQDLIDAMQKLAQNASDTDADILDKAEQIKALQQQWKDLKGRAPQTLWVQFRTLGDTAWAPCAAYFKAQRTASKDLLQQRMDFLSETQTHLQSIDWENPNWKALSEAQKKFEDIWRTFPKLQDKEYRKAKKAHDNVVKQWDNHLDAERLREQQRREKLIKQVEALQTNGNDTAADANDHGAEDVAKNIAVVKDLQQQWAPTLGLKKHSDEQALWTRFKTACDAVFATHHQQRDAERQAENSAFDAHQQRLDAIAVLLNNTDVDDDGGSDHSNFDALKTRVDEALAALPDFDDVSEKAARALRAQHNALTTRFDAYQHAVLLDKRLDYLAQLNDQDLLCIEMERDKLTPAHLDTLSNQWLSIKPLLNDGQSALRKRFEQAIAAQQQGQLPIADDDTIATAQDICLSLELTADLPSPDYAQSTRERLRLKILDDAMNGDKSFENLATETGLYDLCVRWFTLPKGTFNAENSGDTLHNWQARFNNSIKQIRHNNQLKPIDTKLFTTNGESANGDNHD